MARGWAERFLDRIGESSKGCWQWSGPLDRDGYGRVWHNGRNALAHRVAYEMLRGPIPAGLELDHLCRNRACVNPHHLDAVPHRTNVLRGTSWAARRARQTHCLRGHEFTEDTTYRAPNGTRKCRVCGRERSRRRRQGVTRASA
ncbi:HNH endonuclease signature motif containing protein [Streptomyces mobaraensis]|uniref:HNH endonuclease signature motif containing protein n=1 Tax=Streptomyces mobaraensis TaxID=35621 RepID=UPI0033D92631